METKMRRVVSKRILLFGASGFIGRRLASFLTGLGHTVVSVSRKQKEGSLCFDFQNIPEDLSPFECFDIWIQLSGETIQGFWTKDKKKKILDSRVSGSNSLKRLTQALSHPPKKVLIATGSGYYMRQGANKIDEDSPKGESFLSDVVDAVEAVWKNVPYDTVMMRFAAVLDPSGGALKQLLLPFKFFQICYYGNKDFHFPWISLNELIHMIGFIIEKDAISGPVNFVSQFPMTQKKLFAGISCYFHPLVKWTIPSSVIKLLMGEMGKELLLIDQKIVPQKLIKHGYVFDESDPIAALVETLGCQNTQK